MHLGVAQDHGEDVVEVVGDSAGEAPDRFHLLRLTKLLLDLPELGHVLGVDDDHVLRGRCIRDHEPPDLVGGAHRSIDLALGCHAGRVTALDVLEDHRIRCEEHRRRLSAMVLDPVVRDPHRGLVEVLEDKLLGTLALDALPDVDRHRDRIELRAGPPLGDRRIRDIETVHEHATGGSVGLDDWLVDKSDEALHRWLARGTDEHHRTAGDADRFTVQEHAVQHLDEALVADLRKRVEHGLSE